MSEENQEKRGERSGAADCYPALLVDSKQFTSSSPDSEGVYLWKNSLGISLIHVILINAESPGSLPSDRYLGVVESRVRSVDKFRGEFLKIIMDNG